MWPCSSHHGTGLPMSSGLPNVEKRATQGFLPEEKSAAKSYSKLKQNPIGWALHLQDRKLKPDVDGSDGFAPSRCGV